MWRNWSKHVACEPATVGHPGGTEEVVQLVQTAAASGQQVRVAGTGHSFNDAVCTTGVLLMLDRMKRVLAIDRESGIIRVQAGCTLGEMSRQLAEHGLALSNLGDIDQQTIAGAISTGTHGTGLRFPTLAQDVVGLELVAGDGSVHRFSGDEDSEPFHAAQVALGALGVVTEVTLRCRPHFRLRMREEPRQIEEVLQELDELVLGHQHFEFFSFPYAEVALARHADETDDPPTARSPLRRWSEEVLVGNHLFELLLSAGRAFPRLVPALNRLAARGIGRHERVQDSHAALANRRLMRFLEMEWVIPLAAAASAVREVRRLVRGYGLNVNMPIEVRVGAADEPFLSPSYGRESCYVAVHAYRGMLWQPYFRAVEQLMLDLGGRPHWGKLHFQTFETLAQRYPAWGRFRAVRNRLDPSGVFRNAYTDRVLGLPGPAAQDERAGSLRAIETAAGR